MLIVVVSRLIISYGVHIDFPASGSLTHGRVGGGRRSGRRWGPPPAFWRGSRRRQAPPGDCARKGALIFWCLGAPGPSLFDGGERRGAGVGWAGCLSCCCCFRAGGTAGE
jgi:hypothetical protein